MTKARDISKLSAVEVDADATDTTNVTSSGALMDSELTNLAAIKAINQSLVTTASPTFGTVTSTGLIGNATNFDIIQNTSDGSDSKRTRIGGGGDVVSSRGAMIEMSGNEHGNGGMLFLHAGHGGSYSQIRSYTTNVERMRIDSSGNVGINSTNPQVKLQVNDSGTAASTSGYGTGFNVARSDGLIGMTMGYTSANNSTYIQGRNFTNTDTQPIAINPLGGFVGIGTTSPRRQIHLHNTASATTKFMITNGATGESNDAQGFQIGIDSSGNAFLENRENTNLTLYTNNSPRLTIDSSGNSTFAGTLTAKVAQTANTVMPVAKITTSGTYNSSGSSNAGGALSFGQYDDSYPAWNLGQIAGIRNGSGWNGDLLFYVNNGTSQTSISERARLDSAGNVLVGKTTIATGTAGVALRSNGEVRGTVSGAEAARFSRLSSDGSIVGFEKDGASVGSINVVASEITIGSNDAFLWTSGNNNAFLPASTTTGGASNGLLDLGSTGRRFKDLHLSGTANSYRMKVSTASSGASADASADELVVESNGNAGISILSGQSNTGSIYFGDAGVSWDGYIAYSQANRKMTFGTAAGERMNIDNEGRVGIANDTPGDFNASGDDLVIGNSSGNRGITIRSGTSNSGNLFFADGISGTELYRGFIQYQHSDDRLVLGAAGDDRVWIYGGNVAIGHQDAWHKLQITGQGTNAATIFLHNDTDGDGEYNGIIFKSDSTNTNVRKKAGIFFERTAIRGQGTLHFCVEASNNDTNVSLTHSQLQMNGDKVSINGAGSDLFYINGKATSTAMGIKIGTNGYNGIEFDNATGSLVGRITINSGTTAYVTSSDYRLKENVVDMTGATTRLKQLKPKRFNWIADNTNTLIDGFLAHEVSSIVPEAVAGEKDAVHPEGHHEAGEIDPQGIDHSKLVPLLVKTIQELEARITALEA